MNMFEITIIEVTEQRQMGDPVWVRTGTKEVEREPSFFRSDEKEPKTRIDEVYGYAPAIEKTTTSSVVRLQQSVETLDMAAVIRAINRL